MVWRAVLRVVDLEALLSAQAEVAESLERAAARFGRDSTEARTLREGFNLLAKVLFTRRGAIRDVHDLVWLDHLVVTKDRRPSRVWEGDADRGAWDALAAPKGRLAELVPRGHLTSWAQVPVSALGGHGPVRLERGVSGPFRAGVVPQADILDLLSEVASPASRPPETGALLPEIRRMAVAVRHATSESVVLAFAASSG